MNTIDHNKQTVEEALQAFPRWMNRPLARVQVYTWKLFCVWESTQPPHSTDPKPPVGGIRYRPEFRSPECLFWRKTIAAHIRLGRRSGRKISLPTYKESLGEYVWTDRPSRPQSI